MSNYLFFVHLVIYYIVLLSVLYLTYFFSTFRRCPEVITVNDVRNALMSREEFDIFTNEGLGSIQQSSSTRESSSL